GRRLVHPVLLVQEPAGGVRDRGVVVADLVDDHASDVHRDALLGDAGDLELGDPAVQHQPAGGLEAGQHHGALAGDDLEPEAVRGVRAGQAGTEPGDDQRLVRLGDPPGRLEHDDQEYQRDRPYDADEDVAGHRRTPPRQVTTRQNRETMTFRGGW